MPQSEASESADVDTKIENFVAGATEDATAPAVDPPPATSTPTSPAAAEPPITPTSDDQLMADANQSLTDSVSDQTAHTAPAAAPTADATNDGVVSNKKVIEPLDSAPKPDLQALLAAEEVKEASAASDSPSQNDSSSSTGGDDSQVDPHSISL